MKQTRVQKVKLHRDTRDVEDEGYTAPRERASEMDALLDEIDEALQTIDQDLAVNYRQQGGQ